MIKNCSNRVMVENLRDGIGPASVQTLIGKGDLLQDVSFVGIVRLEPGSSIGYHLHDSDGEIYYVLSGSGKFYKSKTETIDIQEGDLTYIHPSSGHGIVNTSKEELTLLAIVYEEISMVDESDLV